MPDQPVPDWAKDDVPDWAKDEPSQHMVPQVPMSGVGPDGGDVQQPMVPEPDPVNDKIFQQTHPLGHTLLTMATSGANGFAQTYSDIASPQLGLSQQTQDEMRKLGVFNDYAKGEDDWKKSVAEGLLKPAAAAVDATIRGPYAAVAAGVAGVGGFLNPNDAPEDVSTKAQEFTQFMFMSSGLAEDGMPLPRMSTTKGNAGQVAQGEDAAPAMAAKIESPEVNAPITPDTPPVAKAGNINLNRINAPEDVKNVIRALASDLGGDNAFIAQRRGVVSHEQTLSAADGLLVNQQIANGVPDWMKNWQVGEAPNDEEATAARTVLANTATEALRLQKVAEASGLPADMDSWRQAMAQHILAQRTVAGMVAEAGRGLGSLARPVPGGEAAEALQKIELNGMTEEQMFKAMSGMDTAQNVAKLVNDAEKPTFADAALYYIINNYLSGPLTHVAYAAAFHVQTILRAGVETPVASLVGRLQTLAGKTLSGEEIGALQTERAGLAERIAEAESRQGRPMTVAEREVMKERIAAIDAQFAKKLTVMPGETAARFIGMGQGYLDAVKASWAALKTGNMQWLPKEGENSAATFGRNPVVNFGTGLQNPVLSKIVQGAGQGIGLPSRFVGAIHTYQKFLSYSESLNALCYRQAAAEGLEGDALAARFAQLKNDPPVQIMEAATNEAKYAALMGEPGKAGKAFEQWTNSNPYTKALVPFSRVMNNINSQAFLERTPIGVLSQTLRDNISGKNGNAAQATAIGKMATGVTVLGGATTLAALGHLHGQKPDDKNEATFSYLAGNPPYSVRLGNWNLPLRFLGMPGRVAALGADLYDIAQTTKAEDADKVTAAIGSAAHAIGHDVLDESGFRGIAELYRAMDDYQRYGKYYAQNALSSAFMPYSVGQNQITRIVDPDMRQAQGLIEELKAKNPVLTFTLAPKIDIFGNPMQRNGDHSWAEKDPVMQALTQLQIFPAPVRDAVSGVKLSEEQLADYGTKAGKLFYLDASRKISDPSWSSRSQEAQAEILWQALDDSRDQARGYMRMKYPELAKKGAQQNSSIAAPDWAKD